MKPPFLKDLANVYFFQLDGNMHVDRDFVKMTLGQVKFLQFTWLLIRNGRILSRPLALFVLRSHNNCHMSSTENIMYNIFGKGSSKLEGTSKSDAFVVSW